MPRLGAVRWPRPACGRWADVAVPFTGWQVDEALLALAAWGGDALAACRYLESRGRRAPRSDQLRGWARCTHLERYEALRNQLAEQAEQQLANEMRDVSRMAIDATRVAIEKAMGRLDLGRDDDPARSAANLAKVSQVSLDKMLALTGRPTVIHGSREPDEILRKLVAMGVLKAPDDEPEQIAEASVVGDE